MEADARLQQQRDHIAELKEAKDHAEHEVEMIIEQTQLDLDDEDDTMTLQFDKLQREQVDDLNAQLHVTTKCALGCSACRMCL